MCCHAFPLQNNSQMSENYAVKNGASKCVITWYKKVFIKSCSNATCIFGAFVSCSLLFFLVQFSATCLERTAQQETVSFPSVP